MGVALLTSPALHSFSNDFITAEFFCTDYLQQAGIKSVNTISIATITAAGVDIVIQYGSRTVTMQSAYDPDTSGNQFLCANGTALPAVDVVEYFQANHQLSTDFDITFVGYNITFTAKEKATGFDFAIGNTTVGKTELAKTNYRIFFRLFLENGTHSGYDEIYSTYLNLQNGRPGVAIAQLGDKIHSKITADIDIYGLEIPGTSYVECKNTARKYYFEFAESYGEQVAVKKLTRSDNLNVIHGGLSFQARTTQSLTALINPGSAPADRFLKQGPNVQYSRVDQPQFLYFYYTRAPQNLAKLVVKRVFTDGTSDQVNNLYINLEQNRKYGFNVSYGNIYTGLKKLDRYEVYIADNADNRISEKQSYSIKYDGQRLIRYFLNWSSWGSLDSRCFTGVSQPSTEINYSKASRVVLDGYRLINGDSKIYGKTSVDKFAASTGFNDPAIIAFNKDFFLSTLQFRYITNTILPIEVTSKSIDSPKDKSFLYAQSFEYQYLYNDHQYSENDLVDQFYFSSSDFTGSSIYPIIISAGTPSNPSKNIVKQTIQ